MVGTQERSAQLDAGRAAHLPGQEVAAVAVDVRRPSPRILAGGGTMHFGPTVNLSDDMGATWQEPEKGAIEFPADTGAALARVWQLLPDPAGRENVVWAGCEPTSLWRSDDGGQHFSLVRALWDHPHRENWYPGAGGAALHTIVPDQRSERVLVAMSTGGVYVSEDGESGWTPRNRGISAEFLPDPEPEYGQCVHKVAAAGGRFDRLYAQNHGGVYRWDDTARRWLSIADASTPASPPGCTSAPGRVRLRQRR